MAYTSEKQPSALNRFLLVWVEMIVVAVAVVLFLLSFFFTTVIVDGNSMWPNLFSGDSLIALNSYGAPSRGDVVVLALPGDEKSIIKRVIALPGDEVDIDVYTGEVFVNGWAVDESYLQSVTVLHPGDVDFPVVVPQGEVFVMGDNREISLDSRSRAIGTVDMRYIRGKAVLRFLPLSGLGPVS